MIRIEKKEAKRPVETTVSLINIVFLMLIFFLVAGQLAPPQDPEVTLSQAEESDKLPPPDALYVRENGDLYYRDEPMTPESYLSGHFDVQGASGPVVKLAADEKLKAGILLKHVDALYRAGATRVLVVTKVVSK